MHNGILLIHKKGHNYHDLDCDVKNEHLQWVFTTSAYSKPLENVKLFKVKQQRPIEIVLKTPSWVIFEVRLLVHLSPAPSQGQRHHEQYIPFPLHRSLKWRLFLLCDPVV